MRHLSMPNNCRQVAFLFFMMKTLNILGNSIIFADNLS